MALSRATGFPVMIGGASTAVTIQAVGDLVVCWATTGTSGQTVTNISDTGNIVSWQQLVANNQLWSGEHQAMWWGIAIGTGVTTVTVTYTAGVATFNKLSVDEWTGASDWTAGTPGTNTGSSAATSLDYPSVSVITEPSVYLGYLIASSTIVSTTTSGFSSTRSGNAEIVANPDVTVAGSPYAPAASASPAVAYDATAAIFASVGPAPHTVLPDADMATAGWSTAPLFSKVNDASDGTVITATLA